MEIPREYNAAVDLIERNLSAGRGAKVAFIDDAGSTTYAQLADRVDRAANALRFSWTADTGMPDWRALLEAAQPLRRAPVPTDTVELAG